MTREMILAGAVADTRQSKAFDPEPLAAALDTLVIEAIAAAVANPSLLALDETGISQLERDVVDLAFREYVIAYWPDIVRAYRRGAGFDASKELPLIDELLDFGADRMTELLDGVRITGVREFVHARAWALATKTLGAARRVTSLIQKSAA